MAVTSPESSLGGRRTGVIIELTSRAAGGFTGIMHVKPWGPGTGTSCHEYRPDEKMPRVRGRQLSLCLTVPLAGEGPLNDTSPRCTASLGDTQGGEASPPPRQVFPFCSFLTHLGAHPRSPWLCDVSSCALKAMCCHDSEAITGNFRGSRRAEMLGCLCRPPGPAPALAPPRPRPQEAVLHQVSCPTQGLAPQGFGDGSPLCLGLGLLWQCLS